MFNRLRADIAAAKRNDPAARNKFEIWLTYSGVHALSWHRFANRLYRMHLKLLARIVSQLAKFLTGIEIHPAAKIEGGVFIDHGTGVVIGETCIIGSHVRIYQGVTLGAKSFKFDAAGNILREPRHPILEDRVVVYSNSSILGRVRIGHDTVIGGNVWQTTDLPPHSRVVQGRATVSGFENGGGI